MVVAISLVAALALRRPELAVIAAPFALVLAVGTTLAREQAVTVALELTTERTLEQAEVEATMHVRSESAVACAASATRQATGKNTRRRAALVRWLGCMPVIVAEFHAARKIFSSEHP